MDAEPRAVVVTTTGPLECQVRFAATLPAVPVALRRAVLAEIPTLAVAAVRVHRNDSAWARVEVEQRLRMLPITSDAAAQMRTVVRCVCLEGCGLCTVRLELDATNDTQGPRRVLAAELRPDPEALAAGVAVAETGRDVSVVVLMPGQRLHCTCVVRKGFARNHASFQAAAAIGLAYEADVLVDLEQAARLSPEERAGLAARCPKGVFDPATLAPLHPGRCDLCRACVDGAGDIEDVLAGASAAGPPLVHVARRVADTTASGSPRFPVRLTVRTTGALTAIGALLLAVGELRQRLLRVAAALGADEPVAE